MKVFLPRYVRKWFLVFMAVPFFLSSIDLLDVEAENGDIVFDFEKSTGQWDIPDWVYGNNDYVASEVKIAPGQGRQGRNALEMIFDFPGNRWAAALVEVEKDMDLTGYSVISAHIYVPREAPTGFLKARFIITAGAGWHFIQMRYPVSIVPGRWSKIEASLPENEEGVSAWSGSGDRRLHLHLDTVRKIAVRLEYDSAPPHVTGPEYKGSFFIDEVRITK